jgi:membrane fusion protein (multidrug efflux system)
VTYINPQVENNQIVEAGTLLLELDPRDFEADLEHAKANLDTRNANARSAQVLIPIVDASAFGQLHAAEAAKDQAIASVDAEQSDLAAEHRLHQDEAIYTRAERDRIRYKSLVDKHEISRSDYVDTFVNDYKRGQAEFSLTQILDRPLSGCMLLEEIIRENLDLGAQTGCN